MTSLPEFLSLKATLLSLFPQPEIMKNENITINFKKFMKVLSITTDK
jgi:hypothetical protein